MIKELVTPAFVGCVGCILTAAGAAAAATGSLWHLLMPINKSLWTSSYALFTAGLASICLGALHYLVDVRGRKGWTFPLRVLGMNAITAYVTAGIAARLLYQIQVAGPSGIPITLKTWLYISLFVPYFDDLNASLAYAAAFVIAIWLIMLPLYRMRIFIKI